MFDIASIDIFVNREMFNRYILKIPCNVQIRTATLDMFYLF